MDGSTNKHSLKQLGGAIRRLLDDKKKIAKLPLAIANVSLTEISERHNKIAFYC